MPTYQEHILIQRDPADVFDYMGNIENEREWQPGVRQAEQIPPGPQRVGTRRRYVTSFLGKKFKNEYVNTIYERPYHVVYESTPESDLQAMGDITVQAVAGGTLVTMRIEVGIPRALKLVPRKMVEKASQKELVSSLQRLKSILDGTG
jgi:carbon monoxide dehydrogenase subunit G